MQISEQKKRIAIVGGGPSGLFIYKRLIEAGYQDIEISIFEKKNQLGVGMPYSVAGANTEHITNVSDNEIPEIVNSISDWIKNAPEELLGRFNITAANFNEFKVLPRLLFGEYLSAQFQLLLAKAKILGIVTHVRLAVTVVDIIDEPLQNEVKINLGVGKLLTFDQVVICSGHNWPIKFEGKVDGYFDSPYPPAKLDLKLNHAVAIKGSSLTAIDAIRTLARSNGSFKSEKDGFISYQLAPGSEQFRLVMHSRNGLLPAVRFHLEDSHLRNDSLLTEAELEQHRIANGGFLSLDYLFEKNFKEMFPEKRPDFYLKIKDLTIEDFVSMIMDFREHIAPFQLLKAEYEEAEKSIRRHESVYWKEMLAVLSFAMNYPAKYLSAEDMIRLQKVLMPLISIVIAFIPQNSCRELLALHDAGVIDIIAVGNDGEAVPAEDEGINYQYTNEQGEDVTVHFKTFVDCVGQPHLSYQEFPFRSLLGQNVISEAKLKFKDEAKGREALNAGNKKVEKAGNSFLLKVPGIAINDYYQVVDGKGAANNRLYIMSVPYIGGFNPDYSGLDFCEAASLKIVKSVFSR